MKFSIRKTLNWSLFIATVTLFLSAAFTIFATLILAGVGWAVGMLVVLFFVLMGVFFDIIGLAAAAADEKPYHAMAAERLDGAKHAIIIVRNADKFSNFCNDVIGDISGIVSGTATAAVVIQIVRDFGQSEDSIKFKFISILFTAVVAALTVGGKAIGKSIALTYSNAIIFQVGRFFSFMDKNFHIKFFSNNSKKSKRKAGGKNGTP